MTFRDLKFLIVAIFLQEFGFKSLQYLKITKKIPLSFSLAHYSYVIMRAMASQITSLAIVYPTVYSSADHRKHQSSVRVTGLCAGNSPVTGEFPAQRAGSAENVSIWWRHHGVLTTLGMRLRHTEDRLYEEWNIPIIELTIEWNYFSNLVLMWLLVFRQFSGHLPSIHNQAEPKDK